MKQNQGVPGDKATAVQGSFYKPVTCPHVIQHNPPEAINIDKHFKRCVGERAAFTGKWPSRYFPYAEIITSASIR